MYRKAPFIWIPTQVRSDTPFVELLRNGAPPRDDGVNRWFLFRREFELRETPRDASLSITVDGRYLLYINGEIAGRGPVRSSPDLQRFDTIDVLHRVKRGRNTAAVLIHTYGVDTGWYQRARAPWQTIFGDGGLYFHLSVKTESESVEVLSDESWRCLESDAWNRQTPRAGWGQDYIEDLDSRLLPVGWTGAGTDTFDDSDWLQASLMRVPQTPRDRAKGWSEVVPFPTLVASNMPQQQEASVLASELVAAYKVESRPDLPIDRRVYEEKLVTVAPDTIPGAGNLLSHGAPPVPIATDSEHDIALLLKFDPLISGYPWIELDAVGGEVIELAVSETIPGEYTGALPPQPRPTRESYLDCAHVARYTARPGRQRFEKFDWSAIRYLFVVIRNAPRGIRLLGTGATSTHYPVDNRGAFSCSDRLLTRLWDIGRYTTLQCTHDAWIDGPGREKRQWIGDGHVHYLISAAAFGPGSQAVDRQFLFHGAESQRTDGLLQMFAPGDHHYNSVQIPDFSLHWICALHAYHMHTGDSETAIELLPCAQRILTWFRHHRGPNDLLCDIPFWHFIEWADTGRRGEAATINALLIYALQAAIALADSLGYARLARKYQESIDRMSAALNSRHWDDKRRLYVDSVDPETGRKGTRFSQHANAMMILAGVAPSAAWPDIVRNITDPELLRLTAVPPIVTCDTQFDESRHIVKCNTYFSHFVYAALAKAGNFDLALPAMREQYGSMLDSGTSTLWESSDPDASTCHAFSASPVYHLSRNVLGVQPLTPGFRRFRVAIQAGDLAHACGSYPCPHGDIEVTWIKNEQGMRIGLTVPEHTEAQVATPPGLQSPSTDGWLGPGRHELQFS